MASVACCPSATSSSRGLRADGLAMPERQRDAAHRALAEHQRQHEHALQLVLALAVQRAGPHAIRHLPARRNRDTPARAVRAAACRTSPGRTATLVGNVGSAISPSFTYATMRHSCSASFSRMTVPPAASSWRVASEQQVAHEALQIRLAGEPLEIAANGGIRFRKLRHALFSRALALAAHGIHQSLAMKRGADDARRHLERRQLGGIDGAKLPRAVEPDDTDVLAVDEHRHDGLGLRAHAFEHAAAGLFARAFLDDAHGAPGAKLRALARESRARRSVPMVGCPRWGTTPSATHSLATTSSRSPAGPVCVSMRFTRSTTAASPSWRSTWGTAAITSGASSSMRLAFAEAASSRSRRCSDSYICASSAALLARRALALAYPRSQRQLAASVAPRLRVGGFASRAVNAFAFTRCLRRISGAGV